MSDVSGSESLVACTIRVSSSDERHQKMLSLYPTLCVWVERDFYQPAELPRGRFINVVEISTTAPWGNDLSMA